MNEQFWILCGKPEHWNIALKDELWGLIPEFQGKWKRLQLADWLFFYATSPIAGVVGFGRVEAKFKQNQPIWPDEILKKEVIYPYRFEFKPEYVLPEEQWKTNRIKIHLPIGFYSGMNLLDDQDIIDNLKETSKKQWYVKFEDNQAQVTSKIKSSEEFTQTETFGLSHDKVKDMIFEIGKMHRYITDKEYIINSDKRGSVNRCVNEFLDNNEFLHLFSSVGSHVIL